MTNIAIVFDRLDSRGEWSPQPWSNGRGELRYIHFLCCDPWRDARSLLARSRSKFVGGSFVKAIMGRRSHRLFPCGRCCSCRNVDPGRPHGPVHGELAEVCKDPSCAVGRSCAARNDVQLIASIAVERSVKGVPDGCESGAQRVGIEELQGVKLQAQTPASEGGSPRHSSGGTAFLAPPGRNTSKPTPLQPPAPAQPL